MRRYDVAIVGGGVIGMACAEALSRAGQSVCIVEKGELGRGASWAGGGMLCPLPPDHVPEPIRELLAESLALYPEWCARLQRESGIDPEYWECGADYIKNDGRHIEYPRLAQVRNPRLMKALAGTLRARGVSVREHSTALGWIEADGVVNGVRTTRGDIACGKAVLAAGAWSAALGADDVRPAKGQMLLLRSTPGHLPRMLIGDEVYLIPRRDGHILVGSTIEDVGFDVAPTAAARTHLLARAVRLWPPAAGLPLVAHWAGLRPRLAGDGPALGPHPRTGGLWLATGHFRIGLTLAPASAARIAAQFTN
ncbi:NAD(P)/FAD-dependent oxidoreductase [Solimonas soli]|uniref:NAD(P)/FAD-dependent oxidoreductase n=1 Tax=Solimonas soli TaxID=413479 RepID=UPI0004BCB3C5|nr:FAD-dependent oxidoreductase [Solimonas soli]